MEEVYCEALTSKGGLKTSAFGKQYFQNKLLLYWLIENSYASIVWYYSLHAYADRIREKRRSSKDLIYSIYYSCKIVFLFYVFSFL